MRRVCASLAVAAVAALGTLASLAPARAVPPTVTPSPGYDARLQEQRAARSYHEPVIRHARPLHRRHVGRIHDGTH
jgi:hypothetical protein